MAAVLATGSSVSIAPLRVTEQRPAAAHACCCSLVFQDDQAVRKGGSLKGEPRSARRQKSILRPSGPTCRTSATLSEEPGNDRLPAGNAAHENSANGHLLSASRRSAAVLPAVLFGASLFAPLDGQAAELSKFAETAESGYSQASYYTSLGLFILSVPGLWSLIKRATKSKIVKKTFLVDGPGKPDAKPLNAIAGEITSLLSRRNYTVKDRGDVATFQGVLTPSRSQAAFLVFCSALSLASVALVLTITAPDIGDKWYLLTALSPAAGFYYWRNATRTEEIKVKMVIADDEQSADIIIQGDDGEVERVRKELQLMEKGMVYVKGILE